LRERLLDSNFALLLALSIVPVCGLTLQRISVAVMGTDLGGPAPSSIFVQMGAPFSHAGPLLILSLGLLLCGWRGRSALYFLASGVMLNIAVTTGYLLWVFERRPQFGGGPWMQLLELNVVTAMLFATFLARAAKARAVAST
jgi:hypothetical protein